MSLTVGHDRRRETVRAVLGSVVGGAVGRPGDRDEVHFATRLLPLLHAGMLVLADRAYDAGPFLAAVHATGAPLLVASSR